MNRLEAKASGSLTFSAKQRCFYDGTTLRYTKDSRCVECAAYANAIKSGRINGVDMRKAGKKQSSQQADKWCEEMSKERSEAIKRGKMRSKKMRGEISGESL